jgi:Ca2+-binding EF-hand superfamily protein
MKAIFSNKTINYIVVVALLPYLLAAISAPAFADNKSALKDATGKVDGKQELVTEIKSGEIRAADTKPVEPIAKAPVDADFKKLDGNSDGKISLKEAVKDKTLATQFDMTDANHDGMIAADEFANYKMALSTKGTEAVTPVTN